MSEYLNKQAVLEWHKKRIEHWKQFRKTFKDGSHSLNETCEVRIDTHQVAINLIQSGAFDAPEMEHINAYWAREGLIKHQEPEVQRLRAALERIRKITKESREAKYHVDNYLLIEMVAEQALSTTTEPTGAERVRELWEVNAEKGNRADDEYLAGIVDTLNALGYKIPGINAPEGDENDA